MSSGMLNGRLLSVAKSVGLTAVYIVVFLVASVDLHNLKSRTAQRGLEESQAQPLVNLTAHLEAQMQARGRGAFVLSIKNNGAKTATAWAIDPGTGTHSIYDFLGTEGVVAPGETK